MTADDGHYPGPDFGVLVAAIASLAIGIGLMGVIAVLILS